MTDRLSAQIVCRFDDLADPGARGFDDIGGAFLRFGFVVRSNDRVHAYVNICPHAGRPLEWKPDAFLTPDKSLIMCSSHGAIFEIETGLCVGGPCPGAKLRTLEVRVEAGNVVVYLPVVDDSG